ncbi:MULTISPECIES: Ku protein [unclassified Streptomyces]|uniref:non-homologous end joining protein Ku n=1 Tax=unclassified Streptomyces TaxID=2593676 RepID=UPI00039F013B|nr:MULTISPECIES: Ku protein [unclassified Streptomyces]MYT27324.1 Ku protein [Streptomyces sp. SID8354]
MRSIWNGSISFGLVTIPVKTYSATDRGSSVSFVRIHEKDGAPIQYRKVCELDGEEVPNEEVGKGYQPPGDDTVVPITDEDLSRLPMPTAKTLSILSFVDPAEIDPLQFDKAYYLGPNGAGAAKPYALLREALEHHEKVAIGKVAMRGRESLAMLRAHDGALVMHALLWPDQIRSAEGIAPEDVRIRANEMQLAETLMDSLGELDPAELHDDYREAVEELVATKLAGGTPAAADVSAAPGAQVIDLTTALEKSVRAARGGTLDEGAEGDASVTPLRGRGTARGKTAAKKSAGGGKTGGKGGAAETTAGGRSAGGKATAGKAGGTRSNARTGNGGSSAAGKTASGRGGTGGTGRTAARKQTGAKRTSKSTAS